MNSKKQKAAEEMAAALVRLIDVNDDNGMRHVSPNAVKQYRDRERESAREALAAWKAVQP